MPTKPPASPRARSKPATPAGFEPRARRADSSLNLRKFFAHDFLPGQVLDTRELQTPACGSGPMPGLSRLLSSSDLWKPLSAAYGKCDGTVSGKYHAARFFSFDTGSFFIWCTTETGDRGTAWFLLEKAKFNPARCKAIIGYGFEPLPSVRIERSELDAFARSLAMDMAEAHAPTRALIDKLPEGPWDAMRELDARKTAGELQAQTPAAPRSAPRPRM